MNCVAPELFENSEIHFFSPSLRAKRLCYTPTCVGHFYCSNNADSLCFYFVHFLTPKIQLYFYIT
ncbi:MAG: hypothetical protein IIW23_02270, partial [Clostridia bacterium]|nr:hypothetical protein [Clostridia bacterium]